MKKYDITRKRSASVMNTLRLTDRARTNWAGFVVANVAAVPVVSSVPTWWAAAAVTVTASVAGWLTAGRVDTAVGTVRNESYAYATDLEKVYADARKAGCVEVLGKLMYAQESLGKVLRFEAALIKAETAIFRENKSAFRWTRQSLRGDRIIGSGYVPVGNWDQKPYSAQWADVDARRRVAPAMEELAREYHLVSTNLRAVGANTSEAAATLREWKACEPGVRLSLGSSQELATARADLPALEVLTEAASEMTQLRFELVSARRRFEPVRTDTDGPSEHAHYYRSAGPMGPMSAF